MATPLEDLSLQDGSDEDDSAEQYNDAAAFEEDERAPAIQNTDKDDPGLMMNESELNDESEQQLLNQSVADESAMLGAAQPVLVMAMGSGGGDKLQQALGNSTAMSTTLSTTELETSLEDYDGPPSDYSPNALQRVASTPSSANSITNNKISSSKNEAFPDSQRSYLKLSSRSVSNSLLVSCFFHRQKLPKTDISLNIT